MPKEESTKSSLSMQILFYQYELILILQNGQGPCQVQPLDTTVFRESD